MEKICFYNTVHIGDTFFVEPFIRNFCDNNANYTCYIWLLYGYFLYNDIKNLIPLDNYSETYNKSLNSGEPPEDKSNFDINLKQMFISNHNTRFFKFKYNNENFIAINTWCIALGCRSDMIPSQLNSGFSNVINTINQSQGIQYINKVVDRRDTMPKLPKVEITKFNNWAQINTKKTCFFYNYRPRSISYHVHYNNIICNLANIYKDYIFIVPRYENELANIPNIKFCDIDFGCIETPDCKNVVMIEKIADSCSIVVTLPTGASWLFFNVNILSQTNKKYILSGAIYEKKLNDWFSYSFSSYEKIINNIDENNIKNIF